MSALDVLGLGRMKRALDELAKLADTVRRVVADLRALEQSIVSLRRDVERLKAESRGKRESSCPDD